MVVFAVSVHYNIGDKCRKKIAQTIGYPTVFRLLSQNPLDDTGKKMSSPSYKTSPSGTFFVVIAC